MKEIIGKKDNISLFSCMGSKFRGLRSVITLVTEDPWEDGRYGTVETRLFAFIISMLFLLGFSTYLSFAFMQCGR